MKCPKCDQVIDFSFVCDNDCATIICQKCMRDFIEQNGKLVEGHDPKCGVW